MASSRSSGCNIESLHFQRYRCFRDPQSVKVARLSLVYGENSAGKSALVRVPALLSASRTVGRPGLALESSFMAGAPFRDVQWRGGLSRDDDPDLRLGVSLGDGSNWQWTFRWLDLQSRDIVQHVSLNSGEVTASLEHVQAKTGRAGRFDVYRHDDGTDKPQAFDGILPRTVELPKLDAPVRALAAALDGVVWLGSSRRGPTRSGVARGARGSLEGNGSGADAIVLGDDELRQGISKWFLRHTQHDLVPTDLGDELHRLVLRSAYRTNFDVSFPDVGEGLQSVFPVLTALEKLRRDGGFLIVEEPESHLHPRLEQALAEHVVEVLRDQPAARVLFETHSEVFLLAALDAALDVLQDQVALHWVHSADGLGRVEQVPLKDGRPQTPRLELAFDTMGVMRRNLINRRRSHASRTTS